MLTLMPALTLRLTHHDPPCRLKNRIFSSSDLRGLDFSEQKADGAEIQKTLEARPLRTWLPVRPRHRGVAILLA